MEKIKFTDVAEWLVHRELQKLQERALIETWRKESKKGAGTPINFINDEIGQYDFGLNKNNSKEHGWKCIPVFTDNKDTEEEISRYLQHDLEYKAKGTWEDVLRFAEKIQEEKRNTEGLILSWRGKIKDKVKKELMNQGTLHLKEIIDVNYKAALQEFDEHFNITVERHGQIKK
tara:strand:- start:32 stop:553 length:522 start_codon:yes stop_codon:yes gene_type:complete